MQSHATLAACTYGHETGAACDDARVRGACLDAIGFAQLAELAIFKDVPPPARQPEKGHAALVESRTTGCAVGAGVHAAKGEWSRSGDVKLH